MIAGYFNVVALQAAEKTTSCNIFHYSFDFNTKHADFCCNAYFSLINFGLTHQYCLK